MNRILSCTFTVVGGAAALLGASSVSGSAGADASAHRTGGSTFTTWRVIYRTHASIGPAAAATGPRNVFVLASNASDNFVLRWNGSAWRKMAPLPSGFDAKAFGPLLIKASSPRNIWVFGNVSNPFTHPEAIVWNGTSWRPVTPQLPALVGRNPVGDGDAVVVSPTSAWYADGSDLLHWNGTAWTSTPFLTADPFHDLAATPGGTVWRVNSVRANGHFRPVAQTWNGTRWRAVKLPQIAIRPWPISISIRSAHDIWLGMRRARNDKAIVLHWNGSRWRTISVPAYAIGADVTAAGRDRVWVSCTARWNGSAWLLGVTPGKLGGNCEGMTGIPGTRSAVAPLGQGGRHPFGEIWLNGKLP